MANFIYNENLFPAPPRSLPATEEDLKTSGRANHGFNLSVGDKIQFPNNWEETKYIKMPVTNSDKFALYLAVYINGKPKWMPMGTIRRMPYQMREVFKDEKFKLNLELIGENIYDYERIELTHGRTIVVEELVDLDTTIWDSSTGRAKVAEKVGENGAVTEEVVLRKSKYPVFKEVTE